MEFDKKLPIYEQLVQYFKHSFVDGTYQAGDELPSRREVAQRMSINPNTVQRAYKTMEEEGLIVTEANVTSRLTDDLNKLAQLKFDLVREAMETFYEAVRPLGMDTETLLQQLKQHIQQRQGGQPHVRN
ncbi:MAG: GntR family transcriptional regulator [Aerococcaceae bacterium]|nr:GntR family transcriptional regulator [Aerococcaceae bacterium]